MVASAGNSHAIADQLGSDPLMRRDPGYVREITTSRRDSQVRRAPNSAGLYEVLDLILDKGIVIDAFVRVSLVGIELVTIDLRVVIASVDTYLRYAEGVERLGWYNRDQSKSLPDVVEGVQKGSAMKKGAQSVGRMLEGKGGGDEGEEDDEGGGAVGSIGRGVRKVVGRLFGGEDDESKAEREERQHRDARGGHLPGRERHEHRENRAKNRSGNGR